MKYDLEKPVIVFYREQLDKPEREALAVIKARSLSLTPAPQGKGYGGLIKDFFPLMGNIEQISTEQGRADRYILCWADDSEEDPDKSWKRLTGVTFPHEMSLAVNERGKKTYNVEFEAARGKMD